MKEVIKKVLNTIKELGKLNLFILIIYSILVIIIAMKHELSQDEIQSWLIARDLNFIDIIKQMQYEGHSFLWHYIIAPFAKLGFSVNSQKIITCLFAISTIFIILKKAPFNKFIKILLVFSGGMIYYYSVFARPYCMIPFLLACIASIYNKKKEHPYIYAILVGLLAHTHIIMLPTSFLLMVTFWGEELIKTRKQKGTKERKILFKSLCIVSSLILTYIVIAIIGYYNCKIIVKAIEYDSFKTLIPNAIELIKKAWLDANSKYYGIYNLYGNYIEIPKYYNFVIFGILMLCALGTIKSFKQGIIFWSQYIFMLLLHSFCWFTLPIRTIIIIYTLMFWVWTYKYENQYKNNKFNNYFIETALVFFIIATIPGIYKCVYNDINKNYSSGEITAKYIRKNIPKKSVFINIERDFSQLLAGYLNKDDYKFYMANAKRYITFNTWDNTHRTPITSELILESIKKLEKEYDNVYLLVLGLYENSLIPEYYIEDILNIEIELEYSTNSNEMMNGKYVYDQIYFDIYKVI